ncbi:ferritin-3, chloroplastic-like [Vigna unguiculata]|uniref:ferritin-3, chloroplastic-like n=1 Tax=Vigna unguiculata TaxID=3917 RepID=UPI001016394C|nr:ferritin-3, chloroplastic-like [Vigna unguiculata]XP_027937576.1 ferritin-3, chloroplastic-like [Vigna unguiculata]XP_027938365.1 ferritin-3, chloroplastic-like [Vigna unguiculata]
MATGTSSTMPTHFIDNLRRHRLGQRLGSAPDGTDHATHLHRHSFEEVKKEFDLVPILPEASLVRQKYTNEYEVVVNEQIKFFKESSEEEREHVDKLMEYQQGNLLCLLEKLTNEKLLNLHTVASKNNDV